MTERLQTQKDNLAKLLAQEDLTIVHRKVPTAYFDLKNRILCCPILKDDLSPELYDLFMGHEVSHALHTPFEGVHSAVSENRTLKGYLNVVEDVRIEKMIKQKYAGLRRSFYKAYNELMDRDFFGLHGRDLQALSLIDKINLITKCGSRVNITLTDEEAVFLKAAEDCKTWEDVVQVATAIYEWSKENETRDEKDISIVPQMFDIDEEDIDDDEEMEEDEAEYPYEEYTNDEDDDNLPELEEEEEGNTPANSTGEEETEEEDEDSKKDTGTKKGGYGAYDDEDGAREALTEHYAHENESDFVSDENMVITQIDLNDKFKKINMYRDNIVSFKTVIEDFEKSNNELLEEWKVSYKMLKPRALHTAKKLEKKNKSIVMHMAKEFEMRQTAMRSKHAFTGKTGKLDMNRLAKYQIVDDVFRRVTYLPEGKNHGLTVLLDWSGSINNEVTDLLEQAFILAMFCRKVNIPHRIYLFSDRYASDSDWRSEEDRLIEIFSDQMNSKDLMKMMPIVGQIYNYFYVQSKVKFWGRNWESSVDRYDEWFKGCQEPKNDGSGRYIDIPSEHIAHRYNLGGTPLDAAIVSMRTHLKEFQKAYGLEKSILTILTDGFSHSARILNKDEEENASINEQIGDEWNYNHKRQIIDPYSRKVHDFMDGARYHQGEFKRTQNLLEWIGKETGAIITGYFVVSKKQDACAIYERATGEWHLPDNVWADIRKTGTVLNVKGYNKLFITTSKNLAVDGVDELDEELVDAKKTRVLAAFKKNQKSKTTSRFLTNEFIKEIA